MHDELSVESNANAGESRDPRIGTLFDERFVVQAKLASGGFGTVYRAVHARSGHAFALKMLHPGLASDPQVIARFRREAETVTRLRHAHTVTAYEMREAQDGTLYIVMELLHGETLHDRMHAHGALPWRDVVAIARQLCGALAEAHALGIVHRDLKPQNVHLHGEHAKLLDFGIAKIIGSSEITYAGQVVGTADYMAPEQLLGGEISGATDIYALGALVYEAVAGRRLFPETTSVTARLSAILGGPPMPLAAVADVPVELDQIVMRCLERQPQDRFPDVRTLAAALDALLAAPAPAADLERTVLGWAAAPPPRRDRALASGTTPAPNLARSSLRAMSPRAPSPAPFAPAPGHAPVELWIRRAAWLLALAIAVLAACYLLRR